ncbi:MAG: sulfotransferase family 2 domain-containing protein [Pararhodobacter sp.]|nr:sulfotransferase family 2 domain-containing protein [Pararhodobacter sp.]
MRSLLDPYSSISSVHVSQITDENSFYHHSPAAYVRDVLSEQGKDFKSYFSFCFVRNPEARVASLHRHHVAYARDSERALSVDEFVEKIYKQQTSGARSKWPYFQMHLPLRYFINDSGGRRLVNKVYRLEDFSSALVDMETRLKLKFPAPDPRWKGVEPVVDGRKGQMSRASVEMIREIYSEDYQEFGY